MKPGEVCPDFTYDTPEAKGLRFYDSLKAKHNILIFSRYIGCSLCQIKLMETVRGYDDIRAAGGEVFFVLQSTEDNAKERLAQMGVRFPVLLDPEQKLYRLFEVAPAKSKLGLVSGKVLGQMRRAKKEGIVHGAYEGDELQLPATFIIGKDGMIRYAHYGKSAADYPDNTELIAIMRMAAEHGNKECFVQ